jgi:hypothetical protein
VLRNFFLVSPNLFSIVSWRLDAYELATILLAFDFFEHCSVLSIIFDLGLFRVVDTIRFQVLFVGTQLIL